ncbi:hypothetical protein ABIB62_000041 [Mucilaginibacter sp. UYP25]|uniref:DUF4961 domain-containing protein n=1 Tax=unclassified Mucilaginibacter TaxID=2617802 RepID=UPI003390EACB
MISFLHIKGKGLWRACAFLILGIVLACCGEEITSLEQPNTAVVGSNINIKVNFKIPTAGDGTGNYLIFAMLVPKGWKMADNAKISYSSQSLGGGTMSLLPANSLPKNGGGLSWPAYTKKMFGNAGNLIDDMEWVVYQSEKNYAYGGGFTFEGNVTINLKVAADGNPTIVKLSYVISDSVNAYTSNEFGTYYSQINSPTCFEATGGTGDLVDFCNPQLTVIDPPKSLDNDFVSLTFDNTVVTTSLKDETEVYLCATAYTNDGKTIKVCEQTDKTRMAETAPNSKHYRITFWPKALFNTTDAQTITKIEYFVTDKTGTKRVGYGNTQDPFVYTFKCG